MATKVGFQLESSLASKHLTDAEFIKGGYLVVDSLAARDALYIATADNDGTIVEGSLCYCKEDNTFYKYDGAQWVDAVATETTDGFMSAADKAALDNTLVLKMVPEITAKTFEVIKEEYENYKAGTYSYPTTGTNPYSIWVDHFNKQPKVGDIFISTFTSGDGYVFGGKAKIVAVVGGTNHFGFEDIVVFYDPTINVTVNNILTEIGSEDDTAEDTIYGKINALSEALNEEIQVSLDPIQEQLAGRYVKLTFETSGTTLNFSAWTEIKFVNWGDGSASAEATHEYIEAGTYDIILYGATSIPEEFFKSKSGYKKVTIGGGVKTIGVDAFCNCQGLTEIILEHGIETIGNSAFENCTKVTKICIPDSVTSIGSYAFHTCNSLEELEIGAGVKYLDSQAVPSGLSNLILKGTEMSFAENWLILPDHDGGYSCNLAAIQVPNGRVPHYAAALADTANATQVISLLRDAASPIQGHGMMGEYSLNGALRMSGNLAIWQDDISAPAGGTLIRKSDIIFGSTADWTTYAHDYINRGWKDAEGNYPSIKLKFPSTTKAGTSEATLATEEFVKEVVAAAHDQIAWDDPNIFDVDLSGRTISFDISTKWDTAPVGTGAILFESSGGYQLVIHYGPPDIFFGRVGPNAAIYPEGEWLDQAILYDYENEGNWLVPHLQLPSDFGKLVKIGDLKLENTNYVNSLTVEQAINYLKTIAPGGINKTSYVSSDVYQVGIDEVHARIANVEATYVDKTSTQVITGQKRFTSDVVINEYTMGGEDRLGSVLKIEGPVGYHMSLGHSLPKGADTGNLARAITLSVTDPGKSKNIEYQFSIDDAAHAQGTKQLVATREWTEKAIADYVQANFAALMADYLSKEDYTASYKEIIGEEEKEETGEATT